MAKFTTTARTYAELDAWLDAKESRKLTHNTYAERDGQNIGIDCPFRVDGAGNVETNLPIWAPPVWHVDGEREPEIEDDGWTFVDGYSRQDCYSGPVMHASEYLGGRMARDVLEAPGVYVLCVVEDMDDMGNPAGWVLLKQDD